MNTLSVLAVDDEPLALLRLEQVVQRIGEAKLVGVASARFAKPLDLDMLGKLAACPRVLTLEEHLEAGGFGSGVLEAFHDAGLPTAGLRVHAIHDHFIEHSPQLQQRHNLKLDVEGVVETALALFPDLSRAAKGPGSAEDPRKKEKFAETVNW